MPNDLRNAAYALGTTHFQAIRTVVVPVAMQAIVEDAREIADKSAAVLVFVVMLINLVFRVPLWFNNRKLKR